MLNLKPNEMGAESFKPKRQAAQNAGQRIREIIQEEDENIE